MEYDIDVVDYAVLKCMDRTGGCWKKRVHEWITEHIDQLPMEQQKSVQTIGRRIDALNEHGLVESCIVTPDAVDREMIIGYTVTEAGEAALQERRDEFLREVVEAASMDLMTADDYPVEQAAPMDRDALVFLLTDAFDIDDETRTELLPRIETEELVGLLAVHFFLDNADATFDPEHEAAMAAFLEQTPQFRRPFEQQTVIDRVREQVAATVERGREVVRQAAD